MWQLMKLELRKAKLGWYIRGAIIANLLIACFFVVFMGFIETMEGEVPFTSIDEAFIVIGALVRATFIIFASVLIVRIIIEEYKNKTISILFTYPIQRKKIFTAKLGIIGFLTFFVTLLTNIFVAFVFLAFNAKYHFVQGDVTLDLLVNQGLSMITFAIAIAGTSFIPLYFGMKKKSVPATIISSIFIVFLISSHNPVVSIASIVYIPLTLAIIGVYIAYISIRNIEKVDV